MTGIRALSVMAGLLLAGVTLAHADATLTGKWTMKVGSEEPCSLTLTADASSNRVGSVDQGPECPGGLEAIGHWKTVGSSLQLLSPSGNLVALLKPKGDDYVGTRFADGRKVALSR